MFVLATSTFAAFAWASTVNYNVVASGSIPGTVMTIPANDVIAASTGATYFDSNMYYGGQWDGGGYNPSVTGTPALNDGSFGTADKSFTGICGVASGYSPTVTYTLNTSVNTLGYNVSQIDVYQGWDGGRCLPNVTVLYSTVTNPTSFTSIGALANAPALDNGGYDAFYSIDSQILGLSLTGVEASSLRSVLINRTAPPTIVSYPRRVRQRRPPSHRRHCWRHWARLPRGLCVEEAGIGVWPRRIVRVAVQLPLQHGFGHAGTTPVHPAQEKGHRLGLGEQRAFGRKNDGWLRTARKCLTTANSFCAERPHREGKEM